MSIRNHQDVSKRTTLTLDDDVAAKLETEMRSSGRTFKDTVNVVLRRGLNPPEAAADKPPFKIATSELKLRPGIELDDIEELLDRLEGPTRA